MRFASLLVVRISVFKGFLQGPGFYEIENKEIFFFQINTYVRTYRKSETYQNA